MTDITVTVSGNQSINSVQCKNCSSSKTVKHGYNFTARGKVQRYFCKDCNHNFN